MQCYICGKAERELTHHDFFLFSSPYKIEVYQLAVSLAMDSRALPTSNIACVNGYAIKSILKKHFCMSQFGCELKETSNLPPKTQKTAKKVRFEVQ